VIATLGMIDDEIQRRINDVASDMYRSANSDYIQFWELLASVRRKFPEETSLQEIKSITLTVLKILISLGLIAFNFRQEAEAVWSKQVWKDQDPDSVALKVARKWAALPREPGLGDLCWLMLPLDEREAGNA
jgi:hypothetical protein